jgi:hypothetical protein
MDLRTDMEEAARNLVAENRRLRQERDVLLACFNRVAALLARWVEKHEAPVYLCNELWRELEIK